MQVTKLMGSVRKATGQDDGKTPQGVQMWGAYGLLCVFLEPLFLILTVFYLCSMTR